MNVRALFGTAMGLTLAIGTIPSAKAATGCTNDLLTGVYGLQLSGTVPSDVLVGVGGAPAPQALAGRTGSATSATDTVAAGYARLLLDGAGGLSGNSAISIGGAWSEAPLTGVYSVNTDCSVALTLIDSAAGTQHFDGVLSRFGDSAMLLQTDAGVGVSGVLRRAANYCDPADLTGSFAFRTAGTLADSGSIASIGVIDSDGQGNIGLTESQFSSGKNVRVASVGTALVNTDCTVSLSLAATTDGSPVNYRGLLVNSRKELLLVRSDNGAVVTGSAIPQ